MGNNFSKFPKKKWGPLEFEPIPTTRNTQETNTVVRRGKIHTRVPVYQERRLQEEENEEIRVNIRFEWEPPTRDVRATQDEEKTEADDDDDASKGAVGGSREKPPRHLKKEKKSSGR